MIVRDEMTVLPRCLDSLQGLYDELCVVDTGSSDGTAEWLHARGARVVVDTSCNGEEDRIVDFARARNAALALASGDWVLQIDADEVLREGASCLRRCHEAGHACLGVVVESEGARWISGRIFARKAARGYRSPIHEYLEHEGSFGIQRDIVIKNLPDKHGKEQGGERNLRILYAALETDAGDGRLWHFLGHEHYRAGKIREALDCYQKAVALDNYPIGRYHSLYYLGCCLLVLGERTGAETAARQAIDLDARYAEAHCLLGDAYFLKRRFDEARNHYSRALACGGPPADAVMATQAWAYDQHPRRQLQRIEAMSVEPGRGDVGHNESEDSSGRSV